MVKKSATAGTPDKIRPDDVIELLVHVPPRGKRVALMTVSTHEGKTLTHRPQLTDRMFNAICEILAEEMSLS